MQNSISTGNQDYNIVKADNHHDSDEELQEKQEKSSKLVIEDEEELKEVHQNQSNNTNMKQEVQSQKQVPKQQDMQQSTNEQSKKVVAQVYPKFINFDYQDINIKFKPEWKDKRKMPEQNKFEKKTVIEIKEPILYTMNKEKTKHGRSIFTSLFSTDYRYIYITDGYMYILQLKNDKMFVKSVNSLQRLFKIILKGDQIQLCFINANLDKTKPPNLKSYQFLKGKEQKEKLLMRVRGEINKLGYDFDLMK
ncbi:unnamed protein product [Paramecium primaurelia]|uniref:Uncharacterized protein n=1 Tax=Paramecium primaurelia TaxID=5886 RepID=A0A8S1KVJ4_PARPR|nr:unnamed protein product [Paramecium primaurelia]